MSREEASKLNFFVWAFRVIERNFSSKDFLLAKKAKDVWVLWLRGLSIHSQHFGRKINQVKAKKKREKSQGEKVNQTLAGANGRRLIKWFSSKLKLFHWFVKFEKITMAVGICRGKGEGGKKKSFPQPLPERGGGEKEKASQQSESWKKEGEGERRKDWCAENK